MVIELYLIRFLFYCLIAFLLGYATVYTTITRNNGKLEVDGKKVVFDFFFVFRKLNIFVIVDFIWTQIVSLIKLLTGLELEIFAKKK